MMQRIWALTVYFTKSVFFSLTGLILLILSLAYWVLFFPPGQGTPDFENYVIIIGALGAATTFLLALSLSARASRLENYPLLVRLPSRVEYLVAVLLGSLILGVGLQLLVAGLALIRGPSLSAGHILMIPPLWLSIDILAAVLATHASDLVTSGWSRVIVFGHVWRYRHDQLGWTTRSTQLLESRQLRAGVLLFHFGLLAVLLVLKGMSASPDSWLVSRLYGLSSTLLDFDLVRLSDATAAVADWVSSNTMSALSQAAGIAFWPFKAMSDAVFAGGFSPSQALAPAVLLLYSAILFLIGATLFAGKDLDFLE